MSVSCAAPGDSPPDFVKYTTATTSSAPPRISSRRRFLSSEARSISALPRLLGRRRRLELAQLRRVEIGGESDVQIQQRPAVLRSAQADAVHNQKILRFLDLADELAEVSIVPRQGHVDAERNQAYLVQVFRQVGD